MLDGALPCSRSCWSYHGSSSSVTNSSIAPELSMEKGKTPSRCGRTMEAGSSSRDKELLQGGAVSGPVRERCVASAAFPLLCSLPPLPRLIRPLLNRGPSRCSGPLQPLQLQHRRGSSRVAAAALPAYQLCNRGAFTGDSETGTPIARLTEFDVWYVQIMFKRKTNNSPMLQVKSKDENKPWHTPHTSQVKIKKNMSSGKSLVNGGMYYLQPCIFP